MRVHSGAGTIRGRPGCRPARPSQRLAVLIRVRVAQLLLIAVAVLTLPASAWAAGTDVVRDYNDNGQIDGCYTLPDYDDASDLLGSDDVLYGAALDALQEARITRVVERAGDPCPELPATDGSAAEAEDSGGLSGTAILAGLVVVVGVVAIGAGALARRRGSSGR